MDDDCHPHVMVGRETGFDHRHRVKVDHGPVMVSRHHKTDFRRRRVETHPAHNENWILH
tara:strand:+ start:299 stop:475 length:177 start_codon:yes stop_codon:yes gene_type:complete